MQVIYSCRRDCCPTMVYDDIEKTLVITDDFGGRVTLSKKQFKDLTDAYSEYQAKTEVVDA